MFEERGLKNADVEAIATMIIFCDLEKIEYGGVFIVFDTSIPLLLESAWSLRAPLFLTLIAGKLVLGVSFLVFGF